MRAILITIVAVFVAIMIAAWFLSQRAEPTFIDVDAASEQQE